MKLLAADFDYKWPKNEVLSMKSGPVLKRLWQLLLRHGFIYEDQKTRNIVPAIRYGTPGTLLRKNIQAEWWDNMVIQQPNVFPVENSCITNDNIDTSFYKLISPINESEPVYMRNKVCNELLQHYVPTLDMINNRLPFSIVQVGTYYTVPHAENKASLWNRNSIEKTSLVLQYYTAPSQMFQSKDQYVVDRVRWWKKYCRNPGNISTTEIKSDDSDATSTHIQYKCNWLTETIETISDLRDSALVTLESQTGISCKAKWLRKSMIPHILQVETYLENSMIAILADSFTSNKDNQKTYSRSFLQLHTHLAPYKVAVTTSGNKEIEIIADHFQQELRKKGVMVYSISDGSSLDSLFKKYDELGIPFTILMNDETLEAGVISLRHRDTCLMENLHLGNLLETILRLLKPV